jgi:N6-L-threonylcarbamoyladenine synthase
VAAGRDIFPCIGFVVSGGHTSLFRCRTALEYDLLGSTRDDAAGEAFDKVAAILGLGFPGGPAVEHEAAGGDPKAVRFPRSMLEPGSLDFSFSGLKTAVLYNVQGQDRVAPMPPPSGRRRADIAASFQQAVVDVLLRKARSALNQTGLKRLAVGGGVSANWALRAALAEMCSAENAELFIPPADLCTDNAAMAALAVEKWKRGDFAARDVDAVPNLT